MSAWALGLVATAALGHAGWNLLTLFGSRLLGEAHPPCRTTLPTVSGASSRWWNSG
jgi:hypothetical protein